MNQTSPAIVAQSAVRRLPRLALILFCVAYVLPGFIGREPWKQDDVSAFGVMLGMAAGHGSWWQPSVLGLPLENTGPLAYWLGAVFIRLLPFFPAEVAVRIPFAALLSITLACTWYATYHLARLRSAQPVAFAFGGEAQPVDYARTLADAALLALVACLGLAQLSHETTPDLAQLAASSAVLMGAARLAHNEASSAWRSLFTWTAGVATLAFSGAPWIAALSGSALLLVLWWQARQDSDRTHWPRPLLLSMGALLLVLLAAAAAGLLNTGGAMSVTPPFGWRRWGRLLLWFTWPAWPLVLWTLWRWRRQLGQAHVALPLVAAAIGVISSAIDPGFDRALLLALPAMATLAAFALPTLSRSVSALIDWFTLIFFTGCALVVWVVWISMMTGVPAKPAANVAKLAPGFEPTFSFVWFAAATLATLAWIWLVSWRVGAHRPALWKTLVLPAGGATLCWLLLMTLWLPLLDYARSYGPVSRQIASMVPSDSCVLVDGLSDAQIAGLQYHGGLRLVRHPARGADAASEHCKALVTTPSARDSLGERVNLPDWAFKATVWRLNDRRERLLVYLRIGG